MNVDVLIQKLSRCDVLPKDERLALDRVVSQTRNINRGDELVRMGDEPTSSTLLLSGFVCRSRVAGDGERQILAVHVPGDFVDLQSFLLKHMDHSVTALSAGTIAIVPHSELRRLDEEMPHLTRLLWLNTLIDAAIHREWLLGLGRRSAIQRMGHFICEICTRMDVVRLAPGRRFGFPLTQTDLSDVLGLSPVHVNRVLQELRADGLVEWKSHVMEVLDWERLSALAEFDPIYLHLEARPR